MEYTSTYGNLHTLSADKFHTPHDIFLHLHQLREFLRKVWPECAGSRFAEGMA